MKTITAIEEFPFEPPSPPRIPPRSRLYTLAPLGLATLFGESLTSFILRLAQAHTLSPSLLVRKVIVPSMANGCLSARARLSDLFRSTGKSFNGMGVHSRQCVEALILLTHQPLVKELNLQFLDGYVFGPGLLKPKQAWCPKCLWQWSHAGSSVYLPLVWNISTYTVCSQHGGYLVDRCPRCSRQQYPLNRTQPPGICPTCREFLGTCDDDASADRAPIDLKDSIASRMTLDLIANGRKHLRRQPINRFALNAHAILEHCYSGKSQRMADVLKVDRFTVNKWCSGEQLPKLKSFLWFAYRFGQSPLDLLTTEDVCLNSFRVQSLGESPDQSFVQYRCRPNRKDRIANMLTSLTEGPESPPPSLAEIAKRLDVDLTSIARHFPELAAIIRERHQSYRKRQSSNREQAELDAITGVVMQIYASGDYPSLSRTRERLAGSRMLQNPMLAEHWRQLVRRLGYRDPAKEVH